MTRARPRCIAPERKASAFRRSQQLLSCGAFVALAALVGACESPAPAKQAPAPNAALAQAPAPTVAAPSPAAPSATAPSPAAPSPAAPNAAAPGPATAGAELPAAKPQEEVAEVHVKAEGQLGPGGGVLLIDLTPPAGAKLNAEAPLSAKGSGGIGLEFPKRLSGPLGEQRLPLRLPIEVADGATGPAQVELTYYWCTDGNEAACRREQARLNVDLDLSGSGAGGEAHLSYRSRGDEG